MEQNNFSNENFLNELLMTFSTYIPRYTDGKTKVVYAMRSYTDRNILDNHYQLVIHLQDFPLWEYSIASFE